MGLFKFFRRKKARSNHPPLPPPPLPDEQITIGMSGLSLDDLRELLQRGRPSEDYLGKAMVEQDLALQAIKDKVFDKAWKHLHIQKQHYGQHAASYGMTAAQTLAIDASVSEHLANILRLEGKHDKALSHVIYWIAATKNPTVKQGKKLPAYFNRTKFEKVDLSEVQDFISECRSLPDFRVIQGQVQKWKGAT